MWPEILTALNDNRHELILSNEINERLKKDGLDPNLFTLIGLNLLRISDTSLDKLSDDVAKLINLQSLLLHSNKLIKMTPKICELTKLKMLDLSNNQLMEIPEEICKLSQMTSLNLSSNKLGKLPNLSKNSKLSVLDLSHNLLEEFPDICYGELVHLSEVKLNSNSISCIPSEIQVLSALKILDLSANKISVVPGELADCNKLKDVNLKENPVSDKRLLKLIDQCRSKQVLDYVRQHCVRKSGPLVTGKKGNKKLKNREQQKPNNETNYTNNGTVDKINELTNEMHRLIITKTIDDKTQTIKILDKVKTVRPFILACIIKNIQFDEQTFKRFIQLQTKLHDSICEKRNAATIATHDLSKIAGIDNIVYTACAPSELMIRPLNRATLYSGAKLFEQLRTEAENLRKEKKRNTYSGVYRYLYLLEGRTMYPCLLDGENKVISFPPIINSDDTKISVDTQSILIEVTSATGQEVCKRVLDTLLHEILELGVGGKTESNHNILTIEKIKIVDIDGNLKAVYPSRVDLNYDEKYSILVLRE